VSDPDPDPADLPVLVKLRGTDAYARFLARLGQEMRRENPGFSGTPNALAEYALGVLGLARDLRVPARLRPRGGARPGAGRRPKAPD